MIKIDWLNPKPVATYHYDNAGRLDYVDNFNGTVTDYTYDNANRLTDLVNKQSDQTIISEYHFTLDGNGNRTQVNQSESLLPVINEDTSNYTYNPEKNRLQTAGASGFDYDLEGQLSTKNVHSFTFDYNHRLKTVGGANNYQYSYDGSGKRLKAIRDSVETRYIYSAAGNLLAEANSSNVIMKYYIHGAGLMAMVKDTNEVYTYHYDSVGNTIAMTDEAEVIVNSYAYTPFGIIANQVENVPQPFKFVGKYGVMTEPNGFYYMRARYYDTEVGRFISEDPVGFDGGDVNLYAYSANNPLLYIDPYGLELRIYNRPVDGPLRRVGANHAFLYSTDEQRSAGMGASSGSEGNRNEDISGLSYTVVPNPNGESERDVMDYMETTMNTGMWFPGLNDCHTKVGNTLEHFGLQNPGAPGGRLGSIPNSPSGK